jgi:ATP-dependent helicase HepA
VLRAQGDLLVEPSMRTSTAAFLPGMIVRFPVDREEYPTAPRDFRIGRIVQLDEASATAEVHALILSLSDTGDAPRSALESFALPISTLARCRVLADTPCTLVSDPQVHGQVLIGCDAEWQAGVHLDYHLLIGDQIRRVSEADLLVSSTHQDPDPLAQLSSYEFQSPSWRNPRDRVIEGYGQLRSATFGIEDLISSRVILLGHQADVIAHVLSSPERRFMLGDEVGLGKTIEACVVLKALRRRDPDVKALIVAPAALTRQWRNELNNKFWLDLPIIQPGAGGVKISDYPGVIISAEDLATIDLYWSILSQQRWGLLMVDEAHHLRKNPSLYHRIQTLSQIAEHVLILTATPIQRRATEYLDLLKLLDPQRYATEDVASFQSLLAAQEPIRKVLTLVRPLLEPKYFEPEEFIEEIEPLIDALHDDAVLRSLTTELTQQDDLAEALAIAKQIVSFVATNYRIEKRIIRNRRASLEIELPRRVLDTSYSYESSELEGALLEALYDYGQDYLSETAHNPFALEYIRVVLHSAASSSAALFAVLQWRATALQEGITPSPHNISLLNPASPHHEQKRLQHLVSAAPSIDDELAQIKALIRQAEYWHEQSEAWLAEVKRGTIAQPRRDRLAQCLRAIYTTVGEQATKLIVFAGWPQSAAMLIPHLTRLLGRDAVAQFTVGMTEEALQLAVDRFQSNDSCCVLVCDELGGEGRNFQIAKSIIHLDMPWSPSQIEQRIGRVDRLGRVGEVRSLPIYARETVEQDLFRIWDAALGLFTSSMSGMEIALETTQDQLMDSLRDSIREGLARLLEPMQRQAIDLREEVEQERYFEEGVANRALRRQFAEISEQYSDGSKIRAAIEGWTKIAGLSSYQVQGDQMIYDARGFNQASMRNARFLPPSMRDAARRSGRSRTTQIVGTFNRNLAVRREDLVFFAPGDDPWTDAVIANALESDRGRCCAIGFRPEQGVQEPFFDFFYSFHINPRYLYALGLDPVYLLQAQSYLPRPHLRLFVTASDGRLLRVSDPRLAFTHTGFHKVAFTHLGERKQRSAHSLAEIDRFRERYPHDIWQELVGTAVDVANRFLEDDILSYASEQAEEAAAVLQRRVAGWEAGLRWQADQGVQPEGEALALAEYRQAVDALILGIRHPICRLESVCFWEPVVENRR